MAITLALCTAHCQAQTPADPRAPLPSSRVEGPAPAPPDATSTAAGGSQAALAEATGVPSPTASAQATPPPPDPSAWSSAGTDGVTISRLLAESGIALPQGFKALVVKISLAEGTAAPTYRFFDFKGTSRDRDDWWPASTVKLFAAVAALERMREWKFTKAASITYHYEKGDVTRTLEWLVRQAITPSNNNAFDALVEIVGGDDFNAWFRQQDLRDTVMLRGYSHRVMDPELDKGVLRSSPAMTIREGDRVKDLLPREGRQRDGCKELGNCTTLMDLSDVLRRVMLHEHLPPRQRFNMGKDEVALLRSALSGKRSRGLGVVNGLKEGFAPRTIATYSKPGFALNWFSDHVFVDCTDCAPGDRYWLVAMAGWGGRDVLDEAAKVVGRLIATGRLNAAGAPR